MILKTGKFVALVFLIGLLFSSCKKSGCTDEFAVNYDNKAEKSLDVNCVYLNPDYEKELYTPDFGPNTATLMVDKAGIDSIHDKFLIIESNYFIRARFKDEANNFVNAGMVEMSEFEYYGEGLSYIELDKDEENFYLKYISLSNSFSDYLPDTMRWRAQGATWPSFQLVNPIDSIPARSFVLSGEPSISSPYTFQVSSVNDADSISLAIHGQRKSIVKVIAGNQTEATFSKEEIEEIGKGNAVLRVMTMQYAKVDEGGKSYYFVNASRSAIRVRIQP